MIRNKKGFTLVELLAVIVILGILLTLGVGAYSKFILKSKGKTFTISENSLKDAAESAMDNCRGMIGKSGICNTHSLNKITTSDKIYLPELVRYSFIDNIKNPYNGDDFCSSSSYVKITPADSQGIEYNYEVCLFCGDHRSDGCE